jgi:hypothetical protein
LCSTFDLITAGLVADPVLDADKTLEEYLDPLAQMLGQMLPR